MNRFERLPRLIGTASVAIGFAASGLIPVVLATAPREASAAEAAAMTLIAQELALAPDAPLTITFIPAAPITVTDEITVFAYRRIGDVSEEDKVGDREALSDVIGGGYGRAVDKVLIDPNDPSTFTADSEGRVTINVASESIGDSPEALQFRRPGLYPVTVDVKTAGGSLVGSILTFVHRLSSPTEISAGDNEGALDVAVVASITAPPAIPAPPPIPGVETPLPDPIVAQIESLALYPDTVPLSVSISPELLGRLDDKTVESLRTVMANSLVLSAPSVPLDPSAAVASGQAELWRELLREGEDMTEARTGVSPSRAAWIETEPLTTAGAAELNELGVNLLLLSPQSYAEIGVDGGNLGDYTLYSQLRDIALPDASSIPAAIFDPTINRFLVDESMSPEMAALYTAADLVAWRDQLSSGDPVAGNSVLLGLPAGGVLPFDRVARLVDMAGGTGATNFVDLVNYSRSTTTQVVPDFEELTLAPHQPVDLAGRAPTVAALTSRQSTVSSMLVDDPAGRKDRWLRTIRVLTSSAITDAEVDATAAALIAEFDTITSAVIAPPSYSFTMNGQSANLSPRITNTSAERLNVIVHLQSSANKMQFPDGDVALTLPAGGVANPAIPVQAWSNGSFTVTLQLLAPDGTPITQPTILTAQVNALTGLAQLLTGGALLILLTWWVRHLRRSRRLRSSVASMSTHPARSRRRAAAAAAAAAAAVAAVEAVEAVHPVTVEPPVPTSISTATTGTATITAATAIAQLDTSTQPDSGTATRSADGDPMSTTLSDS